MPIYEYLCPKCKTEFELMRPFSEADKPAICPKCNSVAPKQITNFASKTGSYLQSPAKPFGRGTPENKQEISPASNLERNVGEKALPRRKNYPRLLDEYERKLERETQNGEIKERTKKNKLNDANRVLESLVATLPAGDIEAKVRLLYRGYYKNIINELKAIMEHRP